MGFYRLNAAQCSRDSYFLCSSEHTARSRCHGLSPDRVLPVAAIDKDPVSVNGTLRDLAGPVNSRNTLFSTTKKSQGFCPLLRKSRGCATSTVIRTTKHALWLVVVGGPRLVFAMTELPSRQQKRNMKNPNSQGKNPNRKLKTC